MGYDTILNVVITHFKERTMIFDMMDDSWLIYDRSSGFFLRFDDEFSVTKILKSFNIKDYVIIKSTNDALVISVYKKDELLYKEAFNRTE